LQNHRQFTWHTVNDPYNRFNAGSIKSDKPKADLHVHRINVSL